MLLAEDQHKLSLNVISSFTDKRHEIITLSQAVRLSMRTTRSARSSCK